MTAPLFDPSSPRYQRLLSKANALSSEQRGLLSSLLEAGAADIATMDMKNYLALAELGAKKETAADTIALGREKLTKLYGPEGIYTKEIATKKDIGMAKIASREKIAEASMAQDADIFEDTIALKQEAFDLGKKQSRVANVIGVADVISSGVMGYAEMKEKEKQAAQLNKIADRLSRRTGALS